MIQTHNQRANDSVEGNVVLAQEIEMSRCHSSSDTHHHFSSHSLKHTCVTRFSHTYSSLGRLQTKRKHTYRPNHSLQVEVKFPSKSRVTALGRKPISSHCLVMARTLAFKLVCAHLRAAQEHLETI